jgi:hypothetical protein
MKMAKAEMNGSPGVVLEYKPPVKTAAPRRRIVPAPSEKVAAAR